MSSSRLHEPSAGAGLPSEGQSKPRRGCFGCLLSGGLGCTAFAAGSILAALMFAPSLLGGIAGRYLESSFLEDLDGELEVAAVNLAWNQNQEIRGLRLLDPSEDLVLRGRAELPGLLHLDQAGEALRAKIELEELVLHRDAQGHTGLARALGSEGVPWDGSPLDFSLDDLELDFDNRNDFILDWTIDQVRWSDSLRPDFLMVARDLSGKVRWRTDGGLRGRVEGSLELEDQVGTFALDWSQDPDAGPTGKLEAKGIPTLGLAELWEGFEQLPLWFGGQVELEGSLTELPRSEEGERSDESAFRGRIQGEWGTLQASADWDEGWLRSGEEGAIEYEGPLTAELLTSLTPCLTGLSPEPQARWSATTAAFAWPVPGLASGPVESLWLAGWGETLTWRPMAQAAAAEGSGVLEPSARAASPVPLRLEDSKLRWVLAPEADPLLLWEGRLSSGPESDSESDSVPDSEPGGDAGRFTLRAQGSPGQSWPLVDGSPYVLELHALRGQVLDQMLQTEGLLAELLGGPAELRLSGQLGARASHLVDLSGPGIELREASLAGGRLTIGAGSAQELSLPMGPAVCSQVIETAVPLLSAIQPRDGRMPATATDLELGLESGPAGTRPVFHGGELQLVPGRIQAALHPGLGSLFGPPEEQLPQELSLLPIRVSFEGPVQRYLDLDLPLAGEDCDLSGGTYSREDGELDFRAQGTLRVVAHKLQLPTETRAFLEGSDYLVEMQIAGTLDEPDLRFSADVIARFMNVGMRELLQDVSVPDADLLRFFKGDD